MKKYRKITAVIAAALLSSTLMMPSLISSVRSASIVITSQTSIEHAYEAYQIIKGDLIGGQLSNLKWGNGINQFNGKSVNTGDTVSESDLSLITSRSGEEVLKLISFAGPSSRVQGTGRVQFEGLENGYYVVKDVTDLSGKDDSNSAWILKTAGDVEVNVKNAKPTVDKQVRTGGDDNSPTWGETSDYAMFEDIDFCLSAKIPASSDLSAYNQYKLEFEDNLSNCFTFKNIKSVKAGDTVLNEGAHYTITNNSGTLKITFNDVKGVFGDKWGKQENEIKVIYTASLNENAVISKTAGENINVNNNSVSLRYSNDPYSTSTDKLGKTPEDKVWVLTYGVDNIKYKNQVDASNVLSGAKFRLYTDAGKSNEVKLIFDSSKNVYRPIKSGESGTEITSLWDGTFNITGIDAGTYYLSEVEAPTGYNKCEDITIVISPVHSENSDGQSVRLSFSGETKNMSNSVINKSGATLPSTGGIGTKVFYVVGGLLAAGSGVILVTKKRMSRKEN